MTTQARYLPGFGALFGFPNFNAPGVYFSQTGGNAATRVPSSFQLVSPVAAEDQRMRIRSNLRKVVKGAMKKKRKTAKKKVAQKSKTNKTA